MDKPKILGQVALAATTITELYRVPVDSTGRAQSSITHTVVSSIVITENNNAAATCNVWIMSATDTAATADKELLVSNMAVAANTTHIINAGIILPGEPEIASSPTGKVAGIVVQAATGSLTFQAFGIEVGK